MASGSFTGSGTKVNLVIEWSSTKGNGGSTVNATLYAQNNNNYLFDAVVNNGYSITINGNTASGTTSRLSGTSNGRSALISHSVWVSYTGDKSITISGYANMNNIYANGAIGERSVSGTAALDKIGSIPSKPSFTAPSAGIISETGGTITVSWSKATSYNNSGTYDLQVSVNGGSWTSVSRTIGIGTTSYSYSYSAGQGNTYRFAIQANNDIGGSGFSYSDTVTTNSISAPTIGNISTYNPYVTSTLSIPLSGGSQANGAGFARWAELYYGSTKLATCSTPSNGNTTASITYSASNFVSKLGTSKYSDDFTIKAWSQNGNGTKSSVVSKNFTVNINSDGGATPTLGAPTLSGGAFGYPSTCFIKGVSTLTITSATGSTRRAPSGTTLSYSISVTGINSTSGSSASYSNLTAGTKDITVTCTDSRGLSTSTSVQCVIQDYAAPSIKSLNVSRLDSPNTSAKATYELYYSPIYQYTTPTTKGNQLNGINTQQYNLNGGAWSNYTSGTVITGLNTELSYTFQLRVSDSLRTTTYTTDKAIIPTITVLFAMRKWGLGINCIPENGYSLCVGGKAKINGALEVVGDIYGGSSYNRRLSYVDEVALKSHTHAYSEITGKPSTFPPSSHTHAYSEITGKPSTFPPSSHTHNYVAPSSCPSKSTSGNWTLWTFPNGLKIATYIYIRNISSWSAWVNTYEAKMVDSLTIPSWFSTIHGSHFHVDMDGGQWVEVSGTLSLTTTPPIYVCRPNNPGGTRYAALRITLIGV